LYRKEAESQKIKHDKFIADDAEAWDIKNAGLMLKESEKMICNTEERLQNALMELRAVVVLAKKDPTLECDQALLKAEEALESAEG